ELIGATDVRATFGVSTGPALIEVEILSSRARASLSDLRRHVDRIEREGLVVLAPVVARALRLWPRLERRVRFGQRAVNRRGLGPRQIRAREQPIAARDGLDPAPGAEIAEELRDLHGGLLLRRERAPAAFAVAPLFTRRLGATGVGEVEPRDRHEHDL